MTQTTGTRSPVQLPADLAPSLVERLRVQCHRRLHRSGRHDVGPLPQQRRPRLAC